MEAERQPSEFDIPEHSQTFVEEPSLWTEESVANLDERLKHQDTEPSPTPEIEKGEEESQEGKTPLETGQVPENFYEQQLLDEEKTLKLAGESLLSEITQQVQTLSRHDDRIAECSQRFSEIAAQDKSRGEKLLHERSKLEADLSSQQQAISRLESVRRKDGKFDFRVFTVFSSEELGLGSKTPSFYDRIFNRSQLVKAITDHTETYLIILNNQSSRVEAQLAGLAKAAQSANEEASIAEHAAMLAHTKDVEQIDVFLEHLTTLHQRIAKTEPEVSDEAYPYPLVLSVSFLQSTINSLTSVREEIVSQQEKLNRLTESLRAGFFFNLDRLAETVKRNDFLSDTFPTTFYQEQLSQVKDMLLNVSQIDAQSIESALSQAQARLHEVTQQFDQKISERNNYRADREKDKSQLEALLKKEDLDSVDKEQMLKIVERHPLYGVDYLSPEEYVDLIRHYSRGLAFHASSLFTQSSGRGRVHTEEEGATKFWGALQTKAIIPFAALEQRGLDNVSNAAGSAAIHFTVNKASLYSATGRQDNVAVVAIAPIEVLRESGQLYSRGFERIDQSTGQAEIQEDEDLSGFYTETEDNFEHPSYELPLTKLLLIMPKGSWIDPSERQSGLNEHNRPPGAVSAEEFFNRLNRLRLRAGLPEIKVAFSSIIEQQPHDNPGSLMVTNWLKHEGFYNENYNGLKSEPLVSLSPDRQANESPRYSVSILRDRFGTRTNTYYWRDHDPEFDRLVGRGRQLLPQRETASVLSTPDDSNGKMDQSNIKEITAEAE